MSVDPLITELRERRLRAGLTQRKLADACAVTQSMISELETGVSSPTLQTLRRVTGALGLDLAFKKARAS